MEAVSELNGDVPAILPARLKDGAITAPVRIGRVDDHNVVALRELLVIHGLVFCTQRGDFACLCGLVGGRRQR